MERRVEDESWLPGITLREGNRSPLNADVGAALERQLLLETGHEERWRGGSPRMSRGLAFVIFSAVLVAVAASGVFFFVQSRKTWEGKLFALQDHVTQMTREGQSREENLRKEIVSKDREIAEHKADAQNVARIAEKTLVELKGALEDVRRLREDNLRLERDYHEAIQRRSATDDFFTHWIPRWLKEGTANASPGPQEPLEGNPDSR